AGGVCFITIEDETSSVNLVVFEKLFEKYRKEILQARLLMVEGKLQREKEVVHVIVSKCVDLTKLLSKLVQRELGDLPVLMVADGNGKSNSYLAQKKSTQLTEQVPKGVFYGG